MKISFRGAVAATLLAGSAIATPAFAQDIPTDIEVSANVAMVTDYRFRGISFSGGDMAIQGGFDIAHSSGVYVGAWASSLEDSAAGSTELDIYAGYSTALTDMLSFDIGMLYYVYPDGDGVNVDYFEPYASLSTALGPVDATVGVAYAWDQSALGDEDNLYIYTDLGYAVPNTPVSLSAHLGYTDGVYSADTDDTSFDWSVGASLTVFEKFELGVSYIGVEGPSIKHITDDAVVGTLSASF